MKLSHVLGYSVLGLIALGGVAAAAVPGPQRMLAPTLYGLTEIAPGMYTDDPTTKDQWLDLKAEADKRDIAFYGALKADPRYILCAHMACERTFGASGNTATTSGWSIIHMPPKVLEGRNVGIALLAHERSHAELHYRLGLGGMLRFAIPNWFDEGLASYISQDPRLDPFYSAEERQWVRGSQYFWDWGLFTGARGWRTAYGAAADNVARMNEKLGRDGLRTFMEKAVAEGRFNENYARLGVN